MQIFINRNDKNEIDNVSCETVDKWNNENY